MRFCRGLLILVLVGLATPLESAWASECEAPIAVFDAGREAGRICPDDAPAQGLTVVNLSDSWVPTLLHGQKYEATYVALADERPGKGHEFDRARSDRYVELFGIAPNLRVVAGRFLDEARHVCHSAIDRSALEAVTTNLPVGDGETPIPPELLAALEAHLVCEGLLPPSDKSRPRWRIEEAMQLYQRKEAIVSRGLLDGETRRVLTGDARETDFRTLLRVLRARVMDATGVIEDGSALSARGTVLGRRIEGEAFYRPTGLPVASGIPDLTSMATEVAALGLGWLDPASAAAFFRARGPDATRDLVVALRLPPPPAFHATHMELRAEIAKGDVWYDLPEKSERPQTPATLTLYARTESGTEVALVRWPTTIGGWKREVTETGYVGLRYKDSDVGPRVWRDLIVTPIWIPPDTTPERTLVRPIERDVWIGDTDLIGPGYASAFGLVALTHHKVLPQRNGTAWEDNGIRTHGSVSYASIGRGDSHGCHRLFNQQAVALASFLLRHRRHVDRGLIATPYRRTVWWKGRALVLSVPDRGNLIELQPPIAIDVLEGSVHGRFKKPPSLLVRLPVEPPRRKARKHLAAH